MYSFEGDHSALTAQQRRLELCLALVGARMHGDTLRRSPRHVERFHMSHIASLVCMHLGYVGILLRHPLQTLL